MPPSKRARTSIKNGDGVKYEDTQDEDVKYEDVDHENVKHEDIKPDGIKDHIVKDERITKRSVSTSPSASQLLREHRIVPASLPPPDWKIAFYASLKTKKRKRDETEPKAELSAYDSNLNTIYTVSPGEEWKDLTKYPGFHQ